MELIKKFSVDVKAVSTNKLYGLSGSNSGNRHLFLSKEGKELHEKICQAIGIVEDIIDYPVAVQIVVEKKHKREFDLDNCLKGILDGITKSGQWHDDSLVYSILCEKILGTQDRISVAIYRK